MSLQHCSDPTEADVTRSSLQAANGDVGVVCLPCELDIGMELTVFTSMPVITGKAMGFRLNRPLGLMTPFIRLWTKGITCEISSSL
jgi:hypothetical protein